jgi:hypothetical protein
MHVMLLTSTFKAEKPGRALLSAPVGGVAIEELSFLGANAKTNALEHYSRDLEAPQSS